MRRHSEELPEKTPRNARQGPGNHPQGLREIRPDPHQRDELSGRHALHTVAKARKRQQSPYGTCSSPRRRHCAGAQCHGRQVPGHSGRDHRLPRWPPTFWHFLQGKVQTHRGAGAPACRCRRIWHRATTPTTRPCARLCASGCSSCGWRRMPKLRHCFWPPAPVNRSQAAIKGVVKTGYPRSLTALTRNISLMRSCLAPGSNSNDSPAVKGPALSTDR
jgi:hypothetical protein